MSRNTIAGARRLCMVEVLKICLHVDNVRYRWVLEGQIPGLPRAGRRRAEIVSIFSIRDSVKQLIVRARIAVAGQ